MDGGVLIPDLHRSTHFAKTVKLNAVTKYLGSRSAHHLLSVRAGVWDRDRRADIRTTEKMFVIGGANEKGKNYTDIVRIDLGRSSKKTLRFFKIIF